MNAINGLAVAPAWPRKIDHKSGQFRIIGRPSGRFLSEMTVAPSRRDLDCVAGAAPETTSTTAEGIDVVGLLIRLLGGMWTFLKLVFVLLFSLEILFLIAFCCLEDIQNVTYARSAFGPIYNIKRVVASQRWHRQVFGCTYAVVELTPARTSELVAGSKFRNVFGDQAAYWLHPPNTQPTPRDLYLQDGCFFEGMSYADKQSILDGLNEPGGWAGMFDEYRAFFLPKRNLIGIMRYGD